MIVVYSVCENLGKLVCVRQLIIISSDYHTDFRIFSILEKNMKSLFFWGSSLTLPLLWMHLYILMKHYQHTHTHTCVFSRPCDMLIPSVCVNSKWKLSSLYFQTSVSIQYDPFCSAYRNCHFTKHLWKHTLCLWYWYRYMEI